MNMINHWNNTKIRIGMFFTSGILSVSLLNKIGCISQNILLSAHISSVLAHKGVPVLNQIVLAKIIQKLDRAIAIVLTESIPGASIINQCLYFFTVRLISTVYN